jgi:outer membrane protein assembly factor BamB
MKITAASLNERAAKARVSWVLLAAVALLAVLMVAWSIGWWHRPRPVTEGETWPQWRGPDGQGHAQGPGYPVAWSETEGVIWKTKLPGRGWSSPVVWGDQVWLTTALEKEASADAAAARLKSNTNTEPVTLLEEVDFHALCVDRASGKLLHDVELFTEHDPQWVHQMNSYASPTPLIEQGRLYCHFGTFGTVCVDTAKGTVLWRNHTLHLMHENGPGSSPVLWKDFIIFPADGSDVQFVAALHKQTGDLVWRTERSSKIAGKPISNTTYATPLIVDLHGKAQLISNGADWLYGYDPENGRELWKMPYGIPGFSMGCRPVAGLGMVFYTTAFPNPAMEGARCDGAEAPSVAWNHPKGAPTTSSPLLVDDLLYFVSDGGIVTCLDAKTGEEIYRERLGGDFRASPLLADGRIYFFSSKGTGYVLASGRKFEVLAKNDLDGQIRASPAAVQGDFYVRTLKALYRIGRTDGRTKS